MSVSPLSNHPASTRPVSSSLLPQAASILFVLLATASAGFSAKTAIYTWDANYYYTSKQSSTWTFTWVSGSSGPLRCQGNGSSQQQWYNMISLASGSAAWNALQTGGGYTAEITYYIADPTPAPAYFYIYARNSLGNQYDIWQQWNGDAGTVFKTISVPLDLKDLPGGDWNVYMGMVGSGAIVISSYVIYSGNDEATTAPVTNGTPSCNTAGITPATGATSFTINPPSGSGTISLANYNFVANSPAAATTNASELVRALQDCGTTTHTLTIPPGKYWMARSSSIAISKTDFTIDGQGATLVFKQQATDGAAFYVSSSTRLVLKNLNLDWDWTVLPLASLGKASNVTSTGCDFTFEDLDATETDKVRTTTWGKLFVMDPVTLTRSENTPEFSMPGGFTLSTLSGNVLHATFSGTTPLVNGKYYFIRHADYGMAGFKVYNSNHVLFDKVNICSIPGMGWIVGADTHHLGLKNSGAKRESGSRNPVTTSRDGFHVMESQGYLLLEDCTFTGAGDDLINIHDRCYENICTVTSSTSITLDNYTANNPLRLNNGDYLEFLDPDYSPLNASSTPVTRQVSSSSSNSGTGICTINFGSALPTPLSPNVIIRNTRYNTHDVIIRGCNFYDATGHGILISSAGATIENNSFRNVFGTPLEFEVNLIQNVMSPASSWWEGDGLTNAIIQNNDFWKVAQAGEFGGAVVYARSTLPCGPTSVNFFDKITVQNNNFDQIAGPALSLINCSNLIVRDNQINYSAAMSNVTNSYLGKILARRSSLLGLGGNTWINRISSGYTYGVVSDTASNSGVSAATNAVVSFTGGADEDFESYTSGATFTSGQTLGGPATGWLTGWKTAASLATPTGTIASTSPVVSGKRLAGAITTQSGKTASSATLSRGFTLPPLTKPFSITLSFRPDTTPSNICYMICDSQNRNGFGTDPSSSWQIASINGTWQVYDGTGGLNAYVDTEVPVTAGTVYDFVVTVDPVADTWRVSIDSGAGFYVKSALHFRNASFATDTTDAIGGRWLTFGVKEVVTTTTVGATGTFSVDGIAFEY